MVSHKMSAQQTEIRQKIEEQVVAEKCLARDEPL
jgi:hypothetical protein